MYYKTNQVETGRSMVEMLGVLAIMGVLSVGGISGYTTAMNKHKANEILNAAAVRAMAVSSQLQNGVKTPTLDEFPDEEVGGATFDGVETIGDKFTIGFSMDNEAVLQQMKNIAGTDGIVRKITDDGLTYNDDLSTGERASDFDGEGAEACGENNTYCGDTTGLCLSGQNQTCKTCAETYEGSKTESEAGEDAKQIGNTSCYCPANSKWTGTECKSTKKEFYITPNTTNHYNAESACASLNETTGGGEWHLASLDEFFKGIGGTVGTGIGKCKWDPDDKGSNQYYDCSDYYKDLNLLADSKTISDAGYAWLAECWESGDEGKGTSCSSSTSGTAWGVGIIGYVHSDARNNGDFDYALCVR